MLIINKHYLRKPEFRLDAYYVTWNLSMVNLKASLQFRKWHRDTGDRS